MIAAKTAAKPMDVIAIIGHFMKNSVEIVTQTFASANYALVKNVITTNNTVFIL